MTSLLIFKSILFANALQKRKKKKKMKTMQQKQKKCYTKVCRICNEEIASIPIFDNSMNLNIAEEVKKISGVIINKSDIYSHHICQSCLDLLNGCILFREMCQRTNKNLVETGIKKENETIEEETESIPHDNEEINNMPSPAYSEENSETWKCSTCLKDFLNWDSYNLHLSSCNTEISKLPNIEEGKKTFLCDICGKTAKSNANLQVHMFIHENVFPFKCDACPYQGRTMDLLKVHKRTHLADKPYKCSMCPKSTTTASNLSKHVRHVHSKSKPYKCSYCDKAFSFQHDMNRHVRDIHLRQGTVECDICSKKFNTKKILQGHRFKIHKIKADRHGRLPSYLQCQNVKDNNKNKLRNEDRSE